MGNFVKPTVTRVRTQLPTDLPDPDEAQAAGHPPGAAYKSDDGKLYRLVHARGASWRPDVRANKPAAANGAVAKPASK